ncbi:unnamed protein product, partial [marine sediment metagenome]
ENDMSGFTLPMRLDHFSSDTCEELGPGAILKNLDDDRRAMFVELMADGDSLVVIMPPKEGMDRRGRLPKPGKYEVKELKPRNFHKWLVLTDGEGGRSLIP